MFELEFDAEKAVEDHLRENWESLRGEVEEMVRQHVAETGGTLSHLSGTNPGNLEAHVVGPERGPRPRPRPGPRRSRRRRR